MARKRKPQNKALTHNRSLPELEKWNIHLMKKIPGTFKERFVKENEYDYKVYEKAKEIAHNMHHS